MRRPDRFAMGAALALTVVGAAQAQPESQARAQAFARLPNWVGLWEQFDIGVNGSPDDPAEDKAFHDSMREHPPYNAAWEARYPAGKRSRAGEDMPVCTIGFPAMMIGSPMNFQAMVTPEETALIFSLRNEVRHIYTDGRGHTPADELAPSAFGESVGHWEGQTLVVDTVGAAFAANLVGERLSDQARYAERIRLADPATLEDQITITDPAALERPWRLERRYHRVPNLTRLVEEDCQGNDRNPVVDGKFTTITPAKP